VESEACRERLWTFQSKEVMSLLATGERFCADWRRAPANWKRPYFWMKEQFTLKTGLEVVHPPIWCWHSCEGVWRGPPTVGTARMLLASDEIQSGMVAMELLVPTQLVLLSSYHLWNDFVEVFFKRRRIPSRRHNSRRLFDTPLLTNDCDSIQAVIPYIDPTWIQRSFDLVVEGREWDEPIFPAL